MSVFEARDYYKPFKYPWAFEAYDMQQKMHWLPSEVPLHEDVNDWKVGAVIVIVNCLSLVFEAASLALIVNVEVVSEPGTEGVPAILKPELSEVPDSPDGKLPLSIVYVTSPADSGSEAKIVCVVKSAEAPLNKLPAALVKTGCASRFI